MIDKILRLKLKHLKYQYLKKIYEKNLSKLPVNCKYNKTIRLPNKSALNICGFNLEETSEVDLCYKKEHSEDCNAFCAKKTKEDLFTSFIKSLEDDQVRATLYKDINILYWLYPELKLEDFPEKKVGFLYRIRHFVYSLFSKISHGG